MFSVIKNIGVVSVLLLAGCSTLHVQKTEAVHAGIVQGGIDSAAYKTILPYKAKLDAQMNEVISFAPAPLVKELPESNLGNFFADVMMAKAREFAASDTAKLVVLFNSGGLRTSVPVGDVHVGNMFELMPFENELVFFQLRGSELMKALTVVADKGGAPVAGMKFSIKDKKPIDIFVHGMAFDTMQTYMVASSDYLANGGDYFFSAAKPSVINKTNLLLRDILIAYCREQKKRNLPLTAQKDGRISVTK